MPIKSAVQAMMKKVHPKGDDALWPMMRDNMTLALQLRQPFERSWIMSLSFIAGKQYVFYNQATELLQHLVKPKGRLNIVDNKILPRFQKQVSRLIRNHPKMSVVPASTDDEDIKGAKKGDKVLNWWWRQYQMRKRIRQLATWIYSTGNCFLDDRWNPKAGPTQADADGVLHYLGEAEVGLWSPFEIGVPCSGFNDVDIEEFPWILKMKFRSLDYIRANYLRGKEVAAEHRPLPFVDNSTIFGFTGGMATGKIDGAVLCEMKMKSCSDYPKGLFLVGANGIILDKQDYPYESYHLEQFKDIEIPGVFWGMASTEAAIWLQKIHNRTLGDMAEYNRAMARGKWLIPRNSRVEVEIDDTHGQKIRYTPVMGHKPEMVTIKGLPASYQNVLVNIGQSFMDLYHQHEVSEGTNKSDIRSGEMVSLLLEQDDFGNIPTHAIFEESLEVVMSRVLRRIQKGYKEDRIIAITGKDGAHEVFAFKGADLKNNTDVHVVKDSSIPDSKVARQLRIMTNYEKGLYGSPEDARTRERVLKMLDEVPDDVKDIFAEDQLDRRTAEMENRTLFTQPGITLIINQYDNHALHMESHRMFRKQPEFQRLKLEKPQEFFLVEGTFILHERQHQLMFEAQQKAEEARLAKMSKLTKEAGVA